jgi:glycosyltransferase involved in cell wall biosynthesis
MAIDAASRETRRFTVTALEVSVVIPCLNEAENIAECVRRAWEVLERNELPGEVIVVDNGSDDGSAALARAAGATVIDEPRRGYGQAYLTGFEAASGDYIVMIDADLTYDFDEIPRFVAELNRGGELVMGNRLNGVQPGAMSITSKIGNPILSGFLNLVHTSPVKDAHCGLRAFRRDALPALNLHSTGMEFASEMVIRAAKIKLDVRELPIQLHQRGGESKLSPFRDGWRHLRLILIHSPTALFIVPGLMLVALGALMELTVYTHLSVFGRSWYVHTLIGGAALVIVGAQVVGLGICGRAYGVFVMGDRDSLFHRLEQRIKLEHSLLAALTLVAGGLALGAYVTLTWASTGFGELREVSLAVIAMTLVVVGLQLFFTSFFVSLLGQRRAS